MQILVLAEGPSEERFIKQVLCPHYDPQGLYFRPTIVVTKPVLAGGHFRGGLSSFTQFRRHFVRLLGSANDPAQFVVTTFIDYYRLPSDFPGMDSRPAGTPEERVVHVERAMHEHFERHPAVVPYLSLHEFEALLFSNVQAVPAVMQEPTKVGALQNILAECGAPERINERPGHGPADRIKAVFPGYQKLLHGSLAVGRMSVQEMRAACPHFDGWLREIERRRNDGQHY